MRYSVQPRDRTFLKGYGDLPFAKIINKNIGKNFSKNLSGKCSKKTFMIIPNNLLRMHLKLSQKEQLKIRKIVEATVDLIDNKITNRIAKVPKTLQQNNSERTANEHDKEIPKERYISPEEIQKNIDDLRQVYQ